jgi:hypothetical protein
MMNTNIISPSCPECQQPIKLNADLIVGQQATCQSCNMDFVITWLFPLSLDTLETTEEFSVDQNMILEK